MRKVAASLVAVLFASPIAFAGTVGFTDGQVVPVGTPSIDMAVSVESTSLADFDTVFLVIGSDRADTPLSFVYADSFVAQTTLPPAEPSSFFVYASDIAGGGNDLASPFFTAPLLVGTLTIDTSALPEGTYEVFVSATRETEMFGSALSLVAKGANQDPLIGSGSFTVVPEPATLLMLGLGGLTAACRRRR